MKHRRTERGGRRFLVVALVSLISHLIVVGLLLPFVVDLEIEPIEPKEKKDFSVSVVTEDELREAELREEISVPEPPPEEEEEEEEPEEEPEEEVVDPPEITQVDEKVVQQETNEETPEEADYISDRDNRTEEETRATDTTTEEVVPSKTERDEEAAKLAMQKMPEVAPEPRTRNRRRELADPSEIIKRPAEEVAEEGELPIERRQKLFEVTEEDYAEVVGHEHDEAAHRAMQEKRLLAGWEEEERIMRGALENFITEVKPGNHTSVNSRGRAWASYLGRIHRKIHVRWASDYLMSLDLREDAGSPLNDPTLNTKLEFVIRAADGEIERINIVKSSGELRFDAEAITISTSVGPHPNPPSELVSPDGNVYVHWNFWRNQRQCGVFGASIFLVEKDEG